MDDSHVPCILRNLCSRQTHSKNRHLFFTWTTSPVNQELKCDNKKNHHHNTNNNDNNENISPWTEMIIFKHIKVASATFTCETNYPLQKTFQCCFRPLWFHNLDEARITFGEYISPLSATAGDAFSKRSSRSGTWRRSFEGFFRVLNKIWLIASAFCIWSEWHLIL